MAQKPSYPEASNETIVVVRRRKHFFGWFVVAVVVGLIGLGFYLGWFAVTTHEEPATHKVDVKLTVDTDKIKQDTKNAADKTREQAEKLSTKTKEEVEHLREKSK